MKNSFCRLCAQSWILTFTALSLSGGEREVQLQTIPSGAQVELNGSVVCATTPCSINVPSYYFGAKHTAFSAHGDQSLQVCFLKEGYVRKTVELSSGPHRWRSLNGVNQYDYYLLTADQFTFQLTAAPKDPMQILGDPNALMAALMLDARDSLSEARDQIERLESRVAELARMTDFGRDFTSEQGVYWREGAPYCPLCWDIERKPARLSGPLNSSGSGPARMDWMCSPHKAIFPITRNRSLAVSSPNG